MIDISLDDNVPVVCMACGWKGRKGDLEDMDGMTMEEAMYPDQMEERVYCPQDGSDDVEVDQDA